MAWHPHGASGSYLAGAGSMIAMGSPGGPPMAMHPADRLAMLEAEVDRLKAPMQMPQAPMPAQRDAPVVAAGGCGTAEDFSTLVRTLNELSQAHAQLLKSHADLVGAQMAAGSGAQAAARLRLGEGSPGAGAAGVTAAIMPVKDAAISNTACGPPPAEPTLMDNTLLFLPERAVVELGLEPNMDDKGEPYKELWFGRVWELRSLLAAKYKRKMAAVSNKQAQLTYLEKRELAMKLQDPVLKARLVKLQAQWKGAAYRLRSTLSVLRKLKFCNMRGTLIYAHGSGGCSWDNFRICRMIARLGVLVVAPDGFAYPKNTAMGQLRHKDCLPLKKADDDVNYWTGDLMYSSKASGSANYSTKADKVLENPKDFCELYERCYQLRRSELHFTIKGLPQWMKSKGFYLGGTSEGAMTIARFDDQRYGEMVMGRFINSFSIEYCYFTPTPEAGQLGGQMDVPTLNIIGTKDQYFGPVDSVAKIVASDARGYGNAALTGNGYKTMLRQGVECGLVCVLEDGVHSPCNTHDNFLRMLFDVFFMRPGSIWELDAIWNEDDAMKDIVQVQQSSATVPNCRNNITQVFVPKSQFPNKWSLRQVEASRRLANREEKQRIAEQLDVEASELKKEHDDVKAMLDGVRKNVQKVKPDGTAAKKSYYDNDSMSKLKLLKQKAH